MKSSQQTTADEFAAKWKGRGYEKGDSQSFWLELLQTVLGVDKPYDFISFENQVKLSRTSFIDAYIESTHTLIEQKSIDKDLRKPIPQSDGSLLTPFQQAKRYAAELPYSKRPRWMVMSNFKTFHVYDMENPQGEPEIIELENLGREYWRLNFLVETGSEHLQKEMEVSLKAGELIGEIYDELLKQYINPDDPATLRSLNILCVRLVFCLYAEDSGLFGKHSMFHDYLVQFKPGHGDMRRGVVELFDVLDTPIEKRSPYIHDTLKPFPYCNGGLFSDKSVEIPYFSERAAHLILKNASDDFDWSRISPTIFGAVFESTLNPETRRSGGMHYTSIENIHKVIDPLFLDALSEELENIKSDPVQKSRVKKAAAYQDKLAGLKFLDPACGSGNFLTETYISLRRLENEAIWIQSRDNGPSLGTEFTPIKVDIHQFYGIEINDFAVSTATTALWIAESQMMAETERIMQMDLNFLPLKSYHNIVEGNALRIDWSRLKVSEDPELVYADRLNVIRPEQVDDIHSRMLHEPSGRYGELNVVTTDVHFGPPESEDAPIHFDYIFGNPPFVGYSLQSKEQKEDMLSVFVDERGKPYKTAGKIDYVAGWYFKAARLIEGTDTRVAFVSTNSITQGEQVSAIWKPLIGRFGVHIDFAWRTFRWDSESNQKAHVHCVIIGFSSRSSERVKIIYSDGRKMTVENINPYLIDADNVFIENRNCPICDAPLMQNGGKPTEGGHLILSTEEKDEIVKAYPAAEQWVRPYMMGKDFIERKPRWCLWLVNAMPSEVRKCRPVLERVQKVREYRMKSPKSSTRKKADIPMLFDEVRECSTDYIAIPKVSSENRRYIPIDYLSKKIIPGDKLFMLHDAGLYHFGVITSNVHMSWMRAVCGRLKSDYSYSNTIVYNNFPWPNPSDGQKARIEQTAQGILDARAKFPDCSLADLYDEVTMPPELRKAHQENDKAVMEAYGFDWRKMTESECVVQLLKMYKKIMDKVTDTVYEKKLSLSEFPG